MVDGLECLPVILDVLERVDEDYCVKTMISRKIVNRSVNNSRLCLRERLPKCAYMRRRRFQRCQEVILRNERRDGAAACADLKDALTKLIGKRVVYPARVISCTLERLEYGFETFIGLPECCRRSRMRPSRRHLFSPALMIRMPRLEYLRMQ